VYVKAENYCAYTLYSITEYINFKRSEPTQITYTRHATNYHHHELAN